MTDPTLFTAGTTGTALGAGVVVNGVRDIGPKSADATTGSSAATATVSPPPELATRAVELLDALVVTLRSLGGDWLEEGGVPWRGGLWG